MDIDPNVGQTWPLLVYMLAVLAVVGGMLGVSWLLGERHLGRATVEPYESGVPPTGSAWRNIDVRFYMVAMLFVIFDMESVFIFAWAVALRSAGWEGWISMAVFIGLLGLALAWLWRAGALEWREREKGA